MKVYKFGGASIKDVKKIRNIIFLFRKIKLKKKIIILSAIGKTTNYLEKLIKKYLLKINIKYKINEIEKEKIQIISKLFPKKHIIFNNVFKIFINLNFFLEKNKYFKYHFLYDQIIGYGELVSTKIISEYLFFLKIQNLWIDSRNYIKTNNFYSKAKINWKKTIKKIKELKKNQFYLTQGFLGSNKKYFTTTLGREGSDYSAAIFSYSLNVKNQTIWKDVIGILNADPRYFLTPFLLHQISYIEAIELTYYGASIIHPKTLQPLKIKNIPLYVRSFIKYKKYGTLIYNGNIITPFLPCLIIKKNEILLSFSCKNFSFFEENDINNIFKFFSIFFIRVDLIQNSAFNFTICIKDKFHHINKIFNNINFKLNIEISKYVCLYTIRRYNNNIINKIFNKKKILLQQFTYNTAQLIIKE